MDKTKHLNPTNAVDPGQGQGQGQGFYPVDNATYNLLQMLTSKLEALEAYQKYEKDFTGEHRQFFHKMVESDRDHCLQLMRMLKEYSQRW